MGVRRGLSKPVVHGVPCRGCCWDEQKQSTTIFSSFFFFLFFLLLSLFLFVVLSRTQLDPLCLVLGQRCDRRLSSLSAYVCGCSPILVSLTTVRWGGMRCDAIDAVPCVPSVVGMTAGVGDELRGQG